jgi:hypothetical protein
VHRRTLRHRLAAPTLGARAAVEEDRIALMRHGRVKRLIFGSPGGIAGTVYGTIVVMATVTAGAHGKQTDTARLAVVVAVTALVFWAAHLYSDALAESLERGRRLDRAELVDVTRRELSSPAAAVAPVLALVLGAVGVLGTQTALWLALGIGVATLGVQGARYAALEQLDRTGTAAVIAANLSLGLVIVGLKALVAH